MGSMFHYGLMYCFDVLFIYMNCLYNEAALLAPMCCTTKVQVFHLYLAKCLSLMCHNIVSIKYIAVSDYVFKQLS